MDLERKNLICCLVGYYSAKNPNIKGNDLKIEIDNHLFASKFTPLGTEKDDIELLDELIGETMMSVIGRGFNRRDRRI